MWGGWGNFNESFERPSDVHGLATKPIWEAEARNKEAAEQCKSD